MLINALLSRLKRQPDSQVSSKRKLVWVIFLGLVDCNVDICPSFTTSFIAIVVCIVKRLRMSNKHLSKINKCVKIVTYDKCLFGWSQNLAHEHNEHFCRKTFVSVFPKAAEKVPKLWPTHPSWVSCSRPRTPPAASWPPSAQRPPRSSPTTSARARRSPATPSSRNRWKRTSHTRRWAKSVPWSLLFLLPNQETVPILLLELGFSSLPGSSRCGREPGDQPRSWYLLRLRNQARWARGRQRGRRPARWSHAPVETSETTMK